MKFTSKDLLKAMGLKVGDRVKMPYGMDEVVCKINDNYQLYFEDTDNYLTLERLLNKEYEILPQPKRVGDLKCKDFKVCNKCPFKAFRIFDACIGNEDQTLYEKLEGFDIKLEDQEIYALLKARLDKEVKE